jgi:D-hexose-6-phosphate mutarotase
LSEGNVIQAFIKNYVEYGVYCSLNIGVSGIVTEENSVRQLRTYFDIGDIIQVSVEGFRNSGHVKLKF